MNIADMDREQVLEALSDTEAEESRLEAEVSDLDAQRAKAQAALDAIRERKIRLLARLAEIEGSTRKAEEVSRTTGQPASRTQISRAVNAVRESEETGEPVVQVMRKIENPPRAPRAQQTKETPAPIERSGEYIALAWQNVAAAVGEVLKMGSDSLTPKVRQAVLAQLRDAVTKLEARQ